MASEPPAYQPFLQRNLKRTYHNLLAAGRVFAVVPWDIEPFECVPDSVQLCRFKKFLRATNVVYSVSIIVAVCVGTLWHQSVPVSIDFFAIRTLYLAEHVIVNVIVLLAMVTCWRLRSTYPTVGSELLATGERLYVCEGSIDFHQAETTIQKLEFGSLLYVCAVVMMDFLLIGDSSCNLVCRTLVYTLPSTIHVFALQQYVGMHLVVYYYFRAINSVLTLCEDLNCKKAPKCADLLEVLRSVHLRLSNLIVQVNDCFGPLTVCTVLSSFVVLTLQLFSLYKATSGKRSWSSNDSLRLVYSLLWIGLHSAKVLLILCPAHRARLERDRTGTVLYRFASQQVSAASTNDVLMLFAGQLLHGKGHCKACGLITLDLTLISKIVAALTTYLVILIQFDSAFSVEGSK
uniref:Gustatory receptor n=1 Tax=Anopheles stephensi TaxID=30069 RepID=A0A182YNK0_ANOST